MEVTLIIAFYNPDYFGDKGCDHAIILPSQQTAGGSAEVETH